MKITKKKDTVAFFKLLFKIIFIFCGHNFWFQDIFSTIFTKIYSNFSKVLDVSVIAIITSQWCACFTQHNLTADQANFLYLCAFAQPLLYLMYANCVYYIQELREVIYTLAVRLKEMFNDQQCDIMMAKTATRYMVAIISLSSSFSSFYGISNGVQALTSNATFVTQISAWPDVEDRRRIAVTARVLSYIVFWIFTIRLIAVYLIILGSAISLSYQFKILCKYFENLNDIFVGSGSQAEKEERYENAFKFGIKMHIITLWCVNQTQLTCGFAFSSQILMNVSVLLLGMIQIMYMERNLITIMTVLLMAASILTATGIFMWNSGDIIVEASKLPNAMFYSGWHNCHLTTVRTRKLVTIAMTQAQQKVSLKAFGFIELSYESYVTIVKSTYSLFSVIY